MRPPLISIRGSAFTIRVLNCELLTENYTEKLPEKCFTKQTSLEALLPDGCSNLRDFEIQSIGKCVFK